MRRLARRLFTLCSAVSLLLCVAACVLWVRGTRAQDTVLFGTHRHTFQLMSSNGRVVLAQAKPALPAALRADGVKWLIEPRTNWAAHGYPRLGFVSKPFAYGVVAPCWLLVLATAALPAAWLRRRLSPPIPPGQCTRCGYDLRASPGRCPECGAANAGPGPSFATTPARRG